MFYLYFIYSQSADKFYVGFTSDIDRRLFEHNNTMRKTYTSKCRPWILKKFIAIGSERGFAMTLEKAVKRTKSRKIIELIISEINDVESLSQLVSVPMNRD